MDSNTDDKDSNFDKLDSLLDCLVLLTRKYNCAVAKSFLIAGLPLSKNKLTPSLFVRAAKRAGLSATIQQRSLNAIPKIILPVILLLKDDKACLLKSISGSQCTIIYPETGMGEIKIELQELGELFSGNIIVVQPEYTFEDRADEYHQSRSDSWFWGTLWKFKSNYYRVALAAVLINLFVIASPLFVMNVYDRVVPNEAFETLWVLALGVGIAFIFDFILRNVRGYLIDISGKKADTILSGMIFQKVMNIRMEVKPASTGAFANNLQGFDAVRDFFTSATLASLIDLPFILLFILVIYYIGGALAIVPLVAIPLIIAVALLVERPIRESTRKSFIGSTQKQAILVESLNTMEQIKALNAEGERQKIWEHYVAGTAAAGMRARFFSQLAIHFCSYALQMVTVGVVVFGVYLIASGALSMGGLIACVILSSRALAPLSQVASLITRYQQSRLGMEAINKIMKMPQEREIGRNYLQRDTQDGSVELSKVSFAYPQSQVSSLNAVSLQIKPGEKVAILGRTGSGKSTLLKLLVSLYQPTEGQVRLSGTDIGQIEPSSLRRNIGYVGQECVLFYGTLRSNIAKGAPWATDEMILQAAEISGVSQFANKHPQGFDMLIGENGVGLSGGQRQAVALARAIIEEVPILLLDEPTSSMDNVAEQLFFQNLKAILANKTLILVTHKLSLLEVVDRVIILEAGAIIADGSKDEIAALLQSKSKNAQPNSLST